MYRNLPSLYHRFVAGNMHVRYFYLTLQPKRQMKTYFVDSFTNQPFKGNPAGVCFLEEEVKPELMQKIAKEIGFSETAFVQKTGEATVYTIQYFSPKKEIPLCGHATLAAAKVLFGTTDVTDITFITAHNLELNIKNAGDKIVMEFPVYDTTPFTAPAAMLQALGLEKLISTSYSPNNKIVILEISDSKTLAALRPDFAALVNSYQNINGVLVTAPSDTGEYDFQYRYFWPWAGTNEDPVTGGIQTFLAPYWARKLNKTLLKAFQPSERTGFMTVELKADKVLIYGEAVIVFEGELKNVQ
jgi:PhzF family phenazine biosynthesis protein